MSGAGAVRYVISEAELARQRELARQEQARRRWRQLQDQRAEVAAWAASAAKQYGQRPVQVPPLADLRSLDEQVVDQQVRQATAETARLRAQADQQLAAGRDQWARELVRQIDAEEWSPASPERVRASAPPSRAKQIDEVSTVVGQLDSDADPQQLRQLVADIGEAPPSRRPALVARLRHEVRTLNRHARHRRETAAALAEVAAVARETGDRVLQATVEQARAAAAAGDKVDLHRLRAEAGAAEQRQTKRREQQFVQDSLVRALASMDYEVIAEDDLLAPPSHGVLVRRRSGSRRRAIHLVVADGRIQFRAARLVDPGWSTGETAEQERTADLEAEQAWCEDFPRALHSVEPRHLQTGPLHVDQAAGAAPPLRLPATQPRQVEEHPDESVRPPIRQQRELGRPR